MVAAVDGVFVGRHSRLSSQPAPQISETRKIPGMSNRTYVVGVGMTKFEKPGSREWDYPDMAREAGTKALEDAGISYDTSSRPTSATLWRVDVRPARG